MEKEKKKIYFDEKHIFFWNKAIVAMSHSDYNSKVMGNYSNKNKSSIYGAFLKKEKYIFKDIYFQKFYSV